MGENEIKRVTEGELADILILAIEKGASDIHFDPGRQPTLRIDGELVAIDTKSYNKSDVHGVLTALVRSEDILNLSRGEDIDSAFMGPREMDYRYRVNCGHGINGESVAIRLIPRTFPKLDDIGFPTNVVKDLLSFGEGLVLVTGPTGSGKSTTLASIIDGINRLGTEARKVGAKAVNDRYILTVEDPVEFIHNPIGETIIFQREVGINIKSYEYALRSALRHDPNVIYIGEIRDAESAKIALRASGTGHYVLSTLHAKGCADAIRRFTEMFNPSEQDAVRSYMAAVTNYIIGQKLLTRADGKGRVIALEILNATVDNVKNHIRRAEYQQLTSDMQTGQKYGMVTAETYLASLVKQGVITPDVASASAHRSLDLKLT